MSDHISSNTSTSIDHVLKQMGTISVDLKNLMDPSGLFSFDDFFLHLHKKISNSILTGAFPNQVNVQQKLQDLLKHSLTLSEVALKRAQPKVEILMKLKTNPRRPLTNEEQNNITQIEIDDSSDDDCSSILTVSYHGPTKSLNNTLDSDEDAESLTDDDHEKQPPTDTHNDNQKLYKCDKCDHTTNYLWIFGRHQNLHLKFGQRYKCNLCSKEFTGRKPLKMHKNQHKNSGENNSNAGNSSGIKNHCDHCNKIFSTSWNLEQHKRCLQRRTIS